MLLLDDEPLFAETLAAWLEREPDLEILPIAHDERSARALLRTRSPAVAVLDLRLGAENGLDLLEEISAGHPGMTATAAVDQAVAAVRRGAPAWLPKTVDVEALVAVISGVVQRKSWIPPARPSGWCPLTFLKVARQVSTNGARNSSAAQMAQPSPGYPTDRVPISHAPRPPRRLARRSRSAAIDRGVVGGSQAELQYPYMVTRQVCPRLRDSAPRLRDLATTTGRSRRRSGRAAPPRRQPRRASAPPAS